MKSMADINLTPHSPQTMNAQNLKRLDQHMRDWLNNNSLHRHNNPFQQ
jgi:hypothetical protein